MRASRLALRSRALPLLALPLLAMPMLAVLSGPEANAAPQGGDFTLADVLRYPFASELASAERADAIAWVSNLEGVRNIWLARGPEFAPREITHYTEDDGQEITQLTFAPDGSRLLYVRGGDHDANWPAEGNLEPDPTSSTAEPVTSIWSASLAGGPSKKVAEGDAPALSSRGQLAYLKNGQVWTADADGGGKARRLFFDRGKDDELEWSPDGRRLAFVSSRDDHAFIGVYESEARPLLYLAPSTANDSSPRWSLDGRRISFVRRAGTGGPPEPILERVPHPWSIWIADASDGSGHALWRSPRTLEGSYPDTEGEANLHWAAGERLVFLADLDGWPHLYSLSAGGGDAVLLTPGRFMVEHVTESRDHRFMIYDANAGTVPDDSERRHLFRVPVERPEPRAITSGTSLEWMPVAAAADRIAFVTAGAQRPPSVSIVAIDGEHRVPLAAAALPTSLPVDRLVIPRSVSFRAADGTVVHGELFIESRLAASGTPAGQGAARGAEPAVVFVHGGPPRQMLLGWHYMDYYSNAYAVNQYLATHGFVVLSVNYRLGIGYGRHFHEPEHSGPAGASEYQDVVAGARYLQTLPQVDPRRIGIWGGSYGGYLTALALARDSALFRAGVDLHGVHDWTQLLSRISGPRPDRFEQGDREQATKIAWSSSPDADVGRWRSPVLLIQGDDDRNVPFHQTVDLARRLEARGVPFEVLVIPNEIHGFLRHASWLRADEASVQFLARELGAVEAKDPALPVAARH
jgi:dipeptidyl aminopeptidase/acylaminoacyl peptidase